MKTVLIHKGYRGLCLDFWGDNTPWTPEADVLNTTKWWQEPVVMTDELSYEHPLAAQHGGKDLYQKTVMIGGEQLDTLTLTGDGGFNAFLFQADDLKKIQVLDSSIEFVMEEN